MCSVLFALGMARWIEERDAAPAAAGQNPSPMVETTRAHGRLVERAPEGVARTLRGPAGRDVSLFVPRAVVATAPVTAVVHFHGAAWVADQAVARHAGNAVSVVVHLGAGSATYDRAFRDPAAFSGLLDDVRSEVAAVVGPTVRIERVVLTAFSAGHGAVRAILADSAHFARVHAVLLLDGMHTSYEPEGTVLADGGRLSVANLAAFRALARSAIAGEKRFLVTHSEIFPGTYASTTETADWLLAELGLERTPVLAWGAHGMQQTSVVRVGGFTLLGYAGNSAPDHVDHLHALPEMLARLLQGEG